MFGHEQRLFQISNHWQNSLHSLRKRLEIVAKDELPNINTEPYHSLFELVSRTKA